MKDKFVLVAAMLLALSGMAFSASISSGMEGSPDSDTYQKSSEIQSYPKITPNRAPGRAIGQTGYATGTGNSGINDSNDDKKRYEKPEYPEGAPGGVMGKYSSPARKPIKYPDMGYQK